MGDDSNKKNDSQQGLDIPFFWEKEKLEDLSVAQWEALCDGCGQCCLNKLEDWDTGEIYFTNIACSLFDPVSCRCKD